MPVLLESHYDCVYISVTANMSLTTQVEKST